MERRSATQFWQWGAVSSWTATMTNASVDGVVSIGVYDQVNLTYLAYNLDVPAKSTQIISTKETYFYLEEGISIRAFRSSSTNMAVTIGYEELS